MNLYDHSSVGMDNALLYELLNTPLIHLER